MNVNTLACPEEQYAAWTLLAQYQTFVLKSSTSQGNINDIQASQFKKARQVNIIDMYMARFPNDSKVICFAFHFPNGAVKLDYFEIK